MKNNRLFGILLSVLSLFLVSLVSTHIDGKEVTYQDFLGTYQLKDSFIHKLIIEEEQITFYLDDIEQDIDEKDPLNDVYFEIKNYVANEPGENLADPTGENKFSEPVAKVSYQENEKNKEEGSHLLIYQDLNTLAMVKDNQLELALNDKFIFQLKHDQDGNLKNAINQVVFEKE